MTRDNKIQTAQTALVEGNTKLAETIYLELLQEDPGCLPALDGMGVLYCRVENPEKGIEYFRAALDRFSGPQSPGIDQKDLEDNVSHARATLLFHLGLALRAIGERDEAVKVLRESVSLAPEEFDPLLNLGQLCFELELRDEATICFRRMTELQVDNPSAWLTFGYLEYLREDFPAACAALHRAVELDNASADACFFLAESLRKGGRYEDSLPYYQKMLQVANQWPQAVHGYGKALLALGRFEDGWDAMEFRLAGGFGSWERHLLPNWDGSPDPSSTILAYSEEGISAEIMFASCLPDLLDQAGHCVIECENSLHGLFRRSFPKAEIVPLAREEIGNVDPKNGRFQESNPWGVSLEKQIAFGSLPRFFRRRTDDFPLRKSYLVPDREKMTQWSERLARIGGVAKIGVLWQGCWTAETERQTTLPMPELRNLMLKHQADAAWICLQHGSKQKEIDQYRRNVSLQVHLFPEAFRYDLDDMAALLGALDLVVTPPGYVANLAGALGVRTWLILPDRADWRWNLGRTECLWYPTMRLYRQETFKDVSALFSKIQQDLERFLATFQAPEEKTIEKDGSETLAFPGREERIIRRKAG